MGMTLKSMNAMLDAIFPKEPEMPDKALLNDWIEDIERRRMMDDQAHDLFYTVFHIREGHE